MHKYDFGSDQAKEAVVYTFDATIRPGQQIPTEVDETQYNITYPAAAVLVHDDLDYLQAREKTL